jgi:HSP20 family molecular chaperone IbpA
MAATDNTEQAPIRLGTALSKSLDNLEETIRKRAYELFLDRDSNEEDSMGDWMRAQSEVLAPIELELKDQKNNIVAECNLKGFSAKEIEIEVENGFLRVFGSHRESSKKKDKGATTTESKSRYFFQSAQLPAAVDLDKASAKLLKNGKLKVTLPKPAAAKKKKS